MNLLQFLEVGLVLIDCLLVFLQTMQLIFKSTLNNPITYFLAHTFFGDHLKMTTKSAAYLKTEANSCYSIQLTFYPWTNGISLLSELSSKQFVVCLLD